MPHYRVHGMTVASDLPLPPLLAESDLTEHAAADVQIIAGDVPEHLPTAEITREHYQAAPAAVLMRAPDVGQMHITGGNRITYRLDAGERATDFAAHLLGSGCAIIHQQRGNVVLHGASLCRDGLAFLVCGVSGVGKSTLAAHVLEAGGQTLGDDVCHIGDAPGFLAHPGPPSTKLASDALQTLASYRGLPQHGLCPSGKTILSTADRFTATPHPLGGIIMLDWAFEHEAVTATRLAPGEAIAALRENTFRKRCITSDIAQTLFSKWSALAQSVPIWRITRPEGRDTQAEIVEIASGLLAQMQRQPALGGMK
ncbi:conserved hypothetical protein [Erythrobacter sp. EC-HK427]|nr:conserved hypothetical protein [Erythrobacter sp. EC-HK427]